MFEYKNYKYDKKKVVLESHIYTTLDIIEEYCQ